MTTTLKLHTKPLSKEFGQQVINVDGAELLSLDKTEVSNLFRSEGVLLFRGFETSLETFTKFTNGLSTDFMDYTGGVFNRRVINGDTTVLSVNDFQHEIKLHGEMYYQKKIPLMLWFFCANPADRDGETIVCDGKLFFNKFSDRLKDLFSRKHLKYRGHLLKEEWQKRYKTDDLNVLKQICESSDIQLHVNDDESIYVHFICPAIHSSQFGEHQVFINSLLPAKVIAPKSISFEDDSEIPDDVISELSAIAEEITAEVSWQKGDILMIDNTRVMHGRRAFSDPKRDIYLRLCSPAFS